MIRPDGSLRDTVMYSVIPEEWPGVREHLRARLAAHSVTSATPASVAPRGRG